jgi:hypothetical protein
VLPPKDQANDKTERDRAKYEGTRYGNRNPCEYGEPERDNRACWSSGDGQVAKRAEGTFVAASHTFAALKLPSRTIPLLRQNAQVAAGHVGGLGLAEGGEHRGGNVAQ